MAWYLSMYTLKDIHEQIQHFGMFFIGLTVIAVETIVKYYLEFASKGKTVSIKEINNFSIHILMLLYYTAMITISQVNFAAKDKI